MISCESDPNVVPLEINVLLENRRKLKCERKELTRRKRNLRKRIKYHESEQESLDNEYTKLIAEIEENKSDLENNVGEIKKAIHEYSIGLLRRIRRKAVNVSLRTFLLDRKTVFCTDSFEASVLMSLLTTDIKKHYNQIPADRNMIVSQLKGIMASSFPKYIIRADVKSCFEHIPFDSVIEKLGNEGYVSSTSLWYLRRIHKEVAKQLSVGIPRGLSFSSYLVELYFQALDQQIRMIPGVYFYKRYVDDIVLVISAESSNDEDWHQKQLGDYWLEMKQIFNQAGLKLHEKNEKKKLIYSNPNSESEFEYLGYKFCLNEDGLIVKLSSHKKERYKKAVKHIIDHYNKTATDNQSLAQKEPDGRRRRREQPLRRLFGQLSALTGNGKLMGRKSNILTGIYYSNIHLTSLSDFKELDRYLKRYVDNNLRMPENLFRYDDNSNPSETVVKVKDVLKGWSFEKGFNEKRFCNNSKYFQRLKEIKELTR